MTARDREGDGEAARTLAGLRTILRRAALRPHRLDAALAAGEELGQLNWWNDDGLLSEEPLEAALHDRHGRTLAALAPATPPETVDWLHVISEAHAFGGHTRLLEMLAAAQRRAGRSVAVAVTRLAVTPFLDAMRAAGVAVHLPDGGGLGLRAATVLGLGRAARNTALHIHPDDLGAALAARRLRAEGRRVLFVNHADHVFSYGPGAADVCLEVSGFGWRLSAARRATRARHFLGIPVTESAPPPVAPPAPGRPRGAVFSVGSADKYRPGGGYDFPAFVSALLDRTDAEAEIVGPSPTDPWWAAARARHGARLRLPGALPFEETAARLAAAAAYVDSFPRNGGTAFPQALMAGKTVFGPGADVGGYNLADALRFPSVSAMTEALIAFLETGVPPAGQEDVRRRIGAEFNADEIAARLEAAATGDLRSPPPELVAAPRRLDYYPDMWRAAGQVHFDLRRAGRLPFADRLALALASRNAPPGLRRPAGRRSLIGWVLRGSVKAGSPS